MLAELDHPKFTGAWIRIHDSGDFHSTAYLLAWLDIARSRTDTGFYCYTKEIALFRQHVEPDPSPNFRWVYSYGGTQDADLDPERDRVADVFADEQATQDAGWHSQAESDLLAVLGPAPVGIPANRIPRFTRLQNGRRWSDWQADTAAERGYGRDWQKNRAAYLREHRLCAQCRQPATVADHHPETRRSLVARGVADPTPGTDSGHSANRATTDTPHSRAQVAGTSATPPSGERYLVASTSKYNLF
ncbi:hypothetical protein B1H26_21835 [Amycolatopsis sp. BJA-103]|nr:hypothetical protein BKN51_12720 [Amycolatopsis sp. BJA-103]PNE17562.1 hypothetical protein B1H26_21835 [Amycolatopsis sp. BJA-103]